MAASFLAAPERGASVVRRWRCGRPTAGGGRPALCGRVLPLGGGAEEGRSSLLSPAAGVPSDGARRHSVSIPLSHGVTAVAGSP